MVCTECGSDNLDGVRFCMNCGHKLFDEVTEEKATESPEETEEKTEKEEALEQDETLEKKESGEKQESSEKIAECKKKEKKKEKKDKKDKKDKSFQDQQKKILPFGRKRKVREDKTEEVKENNSNEPGSLEVNLENLKKENFGQEVLEEKIPAEREALEESSKKETAMEENMEGELSENIKSEDIKSEEIVADTRVAGDFVTETKGAEEFGAPKKETNMKKSGALQGVLVGTTAVLLLAGASGAGYYYYINTPDYKYQNCIKTADEHMANKEYEAAIAAYRKATEYKEMDITTKACVYKATLALAQNIYEAGDVNGALAKYEEARNYSVGNIEVDEAQCVIYLSEAQKKLSDRQFQDALDYYEKALELGASQTQIKAAKLSLYQAWGDENFDAGKYKEAAECYENAYDLGGEYEKIDLAYAKYYLQKANDYYVAEDIEQASEYLKKGYEYVTKDEDRTQYEALADLIAVKRRDLKAQSHGYVILTDENGNVYDLGGMEITICDWWSDTEESIDENNSYAVEREEYLRWIQDTYHFTIRKEKKYEWSDAIESFMSFTTAKGEENYIFTVYQSPKLAEAVQKNLLYNLETLNCLDFSNAKFTQNKIHEVYAGQNGIYGMNADSIEPRGGVYFNKRILSEAGIDPEAIYELQVANEWTWEKWLQIMDQVQSTTGIRGTTQNQDVLIDAAVFSNGGEYIGKENGEYVCKIESEETREALQFVVDLYGKYTSVPGSSSSFNDYRQVFLKGEAAFLVEDGYACVKGSYLCDMEDEIGFVCFPKGPMAEEYISYIDNNVVVIPASYDVDKAWKIAFAWNLYTNPVPGYEDYDAVMRDYQESEMDNRVFGETIPLMRNKAANTWDVAIGGIDRHADLIQNVSSGTRLSSFLKGIRKNWNKAIEKNQ